MMHPRLRAALLQGSMLLSPALVLAPPAAAQTVAPNARPQGGVVVGGAASIAQGATTTTINQATDRAIIDWRSFSVGRDQTVQFQQPSASAMALNRVTGPDPSVIAGRVTANGGIALVNQSGVFFAGGAQVSAQSVIVSTADIANAGFMAGGALRFDRPGRPDARVENAGTITVKQAGLAALVAPQVANSGVIQANLATVVLGGAQRHVIDIAGDGLVAFDVTEAVGTRPANGGALVGNTGTINAQGGKVLLTARAADGIVQELVRAGGTINAGTDPGTGRTGQVLFTGTGGSIRVEGAVDATGTAPGTTGGSVTVAADRVLVAAPARISASGAAGGGTIAIGITGGFKAERVGIEAGAILRADATVRGKGGRIDVIAKNMAVHQGVITARGGPQGGDGGVVELSSAGGLSLGGVIDVSAPAGAMGSVLIDPTSLVIVADGDPRINVFPADLADLILAGGDAPDQAFLGAGTVGSITGNLTLQATSTLTVGAAVTKPTGDLLLETGGTLAINADLTLGGGNLVLSAPVQTITALVQVGAAGTVTLLNPVRVSKGTSVVESGNGLIVAGTLTGGGFVPFETIVLDGQNRVGTLTNLTNTTGDYFITNATALLVQGNTGGNGRTRIDVRAGDLTIDGAVGANTPLTLRAAGNLILTAAGGVAAAQTIEMDAAFDFAANALSTTAPGSLALAGTMLVNGGSPGTGLLILGAGTGGIAQTGGFLATPTLTATSTGGIALDSAGGDFFSGNRIDTLRNAVAGADFSLSAYALSSFGSIGLGGPLQLSGDIAATGTLSLTALNSGLLELPGARIIAAGLNATATAGFFGIDFQGDNRVATLGTMAAGTLNFRNVVDLAVAGPVDTNFTSIAVAGGNLNVTGAITTQDGNTTLVASGDVAIGPGASVTGVAFDSSPIVVIRAASPDSGFDPALPGRITLAGNVSGSMLGLYAGTGGISQTGGALTFDQITARSGGAALLGGPNAVGRLLDIDAAGDFVFGNGANPIEVAGHITAANATLTTTGSLFLSSGCTSFGASCTVTDATIDVGGGTVVLLSTALAMTQPANLVAAGLVEIASPTAMPLLAGGAAASVVAGSLSVNQDVLSRVDATTLRLGAAGPAGTTASSIRVVAPVGFANTLDLRSTGAIAQDAGATLNVGTLTGIAGGAIALAEANTIGAVGDLSATGPIDLTVAGQMTIAGLISTPGQTVTLVAGTGIAETGTGGVSAGTLAAHSAGGDIDMTRANTVDALGDVTAAGTIAFTDGVSLTVAAGATVAATGVTLSTAGALAIAGTLDGTTVSLFGAAGIAGGGSVIANLLLAQGNAGDIALTGDNRVLTLGDSSTSGSFTLNDGVRLLTIRAGSIISAAGITIADAGQIAVAGTLNAPGHTVSLTADTGIGGAGVIFALTLNAATTAGDVSLTGNNQALNLGTVSAPAGRVTYNSGAPGLAVAGPVSARDGVAIVATSGLAVDGLISTPGQAVDLTAWSISGAGSIVAGVLNAQATAAGDISLTGANAVQVLGSVTTPGNFTFVDNVATLSVGDNIVAGGAIDLRNSGALAIVGTLSAPGRHISLAAGGDIAGSGVILAGTLDAVTSGGAVTLAGANLVDAINVIAAAGPVTFNDAAPGLTVRAGGGIAGNGVTLTEAGALVVDGRIDSPSRTVTLAAASIAGGGAITTSRLDMTASDGPIALTGANQVDALGPVTTPADLSFNNAGARIAVPAGSTVQAGGAVSIAAAGDLVIDGTVTGTVTGLRAGGLLAVNGTSAIARNGDLNLAGSVVTVTGLIAAAGNILIDAGSANLSGQATGRTLRVNAPAIAFGGLNAARMQVELFLGAGGRARGTLDAGGLLVAGGRGVTLFGTLAGVAGEPAAALGVRADAAGTPFRGPPPSPGLFTLNNCAIAVTVCHPLVVAPITVANNPVVIMQQLRPRRFAVELTDSVLLQPRPRAVNLLNAPGRDADEDLDLAPPNVRAEDY